MADPSYRRIVSHYESCLRRFGEGPKAVDWKSQRDAELRYDVMLGLVRDGGEAVSLLDFGCGLAGLKDHLDRRNVSRIAYSGLDLSPEFADAARRRHPESTIYCCDCLVGDCETPQFDYVVMNGIFTRRHDLGMEEMTRYMHALCARTFALCRVGLAFNVMSPYVDWRDEALYHPNLGEVADFIATVLSRNFVLRNDYGLYECTCYVYREPAGEAGLGR